MARTEDSCGFAANIGAGTKRGQKGDKAGTVSVCEKNYSFTYKPPPFLPTLSHALADLVALPVLWVALRLVLCVCCLPWPARWPRPSFTLNRPGHPRKWPRKGFPHGPPLPGGAGWRCCPACCVGRPCGVTWCERAVPGDLIQRQQSQAFDLVRCPVPVLTNARPRAASLDTHAIPRDIITATPNRGPVLKNTLKQAVQRPR